MLNHVEGQVIAIPKLNRTVGNSESISALFLSSPTPTFPRPPLSLLLSPTSFHDYQAVAILVLMTQELHEPTLLLHPGYLKQPAQLWSSRQRTDCLAGNESSLYPLPFLEKATKKKKKALDAHTCEYTQTHMHTHMSIVFLNLHLHMLFHFLGGLTVST